MRTFRLVFATLLLSAIPVLAQETQETIPEPTQRTDAPYRIFRTQNIYMLLKLDTRTGLVWQVQWGDTEHRFIEPINLKVLAQNGKPGRFSLYPTLNIFTFLLLDQEDGRTWQVQWGKASDRQILAINDSQR
jgi:hypothetical protein